MERKLAVFFAMSIFLLLDARSSFAQSITLDNILKLTLHNILKFDNGYPEITWPKQLDPFPNWGPGVPRIDRPGQLNPFCLGMPDNCRAENLDKMNERSSGNRGRCPRPIPIPVGGNLWCRGPGPNSAVRAGDAACFFGFDTWAVCTGVSDGSDPGFGQFRSNGVPCSCPASRGDWVGTGIVIKNGSGPSAARVNAPIYRSQPSRSGKICFTPFGQHPMAAARARGAPCYIDSPNGRIYGTIN